jgi:F0F1-type ATP synthase alpha subunit
MICGGRHPPFRGELIHYLDNSKPELLAAIRDKKELTDEIKGQLKAAINEAKVRFGKAPAKA